MKISENNYFYYNKNFTQTAFSANKTATQNKPAKQNQVNSFFDSLNKKENYPDIAFQYEENASDLCDFCYKQKGDAQKVLDGAISIMKAHNITGDSPHSEKILDENGNIKAEFSSRCSGAKTNGSKFHVDYLYDTLYREYDNNGNLKRSIEFSRQSFENPHNFDVVQKFTAAPFIKNIKEYDENGNPVRIIKGSSKKVSNLRAIELFDNDEKIRINFSNGRLVDYQKGNFTTFGDFLKCPDIFRFDDDKLSSVKRNLVYYGAYVVNCETYKYSDGRFWSFDREKDPRLQEFYTN